MLAGTRKSATKAEINAAMQAEIWGLKSTVGGYTHVLGHGMVRDGDPMPQNTFFKNILDPKLEKERADFFSLLGQFAQEDVPVDVLIKLVDGAMEHYPKLIDDHHPQLLTMLRNAADIAREIPSGSDNSNNEAVERINNAIEKLIEHNISRSTPKLVQLTSEVDAGAAAPAAAARKDNNVW